jgi:hypothetical protein
VVLPPPLSVGRSVLCQARDNVSGFKARGPSCDLIEMWTVMDQGTDEDHHRCTLS